MGQKINPLAFRLGVVRESSSRWFASSKNFSQFLEADAKIRRYINTHLKAAGISKINIERPARNAKITIHAARPGAIIGKKGSDIDDIRAAINRIVQVPVHVSVKEVKKPEFDAALVAENIAQQLEKRAMFRRVMKRAVQSTMRAGALGVRVSLSGRLGGAEIARREWHKEGRVPLHTLSADIDYATARANTTYGVIGVKVWIYKGNISKDSSSKKQDKS